MVLFASACTTATDPQQPDVQRFRYGGSRITRHTASLPVLLRAAVFCIFRFRSILYLQVPDRDIGRRQVGDSVKYCRLASIAALS